MSFDINDELHWNQVQQGIKRNIQFPSKGAQYLGEFLSSVRATMLGSPVPVKSSSHKTLEEIVTEEFDKRVDKIVATVMTQVREELQAMSAGVSEPEESIEPTDEELEKLTSPDDQTKDE